MQNFRALGAPPPDPRASGGWGLCPQTPSLRQLGASPPDPHWPPAAGGSAPRPPKQSPHCEFLATRLLIAQGMYYLPSSGLECRVENKHTIDAKITSQMNHTLTQKL